MTYITTTGAKAIGNGPRGILIQNNKALTGTVTVTDGGTTVAVITNPTVGDSYTYYGFQGEVAVNPSAACDLTVSILRS